MPKFRYVRRSTDDEKQALSVQSQIEELDRRFPEEEIVETIEEDASAFKPNYRPRFAEMMRRIEAGEADGIVAWHPDRLSRNAIDAAVIIDAIDRGVIKDLKFGSYHFFNSPEGKMMLGFALAQSKYYSEKLGIDVLRGMEKKCRMGHMPVKARVGYRNVRTEDRGRRYITEDPARFDAVQHMWKELLTGRHSVPDIWRKARDEWGLTMPPSRRQPERPISLTTVYDTFENGLFYTGYFEWNGQRYKGQHRAMITLEEFERAQGILGRRGKYRTTKRGFPFTGCIRCGECSSMITAELKRKLLRRSGAVATYVYYSCVGKKGPCSQRGHVREGDLALLLRPYVEAINVSPRVLAWVRDRLGRVTAEDQQRRKVERQDLRRKYDNCTKAMENLVALYVSGENGDKSLLGDEEFRKQKARLVADRDRYKALLDENERNADAGLEQVIRIFDFARNALAHFDADPGDVATKRAILTTIGSNWKLFRGLVDAEAKFPFLRIREGIDASRLLSGRPEPAILAGKAITMADSPLSEGELSIWWPIVEAVRTYCQSLEGRDLSIPRLEPGDLAAPSRPAPAK